MLGLNRKRYSRFHVFCCIVHSQLRFKVNVFSIRKHDVPRCCLDLDSTFPPTETSVSVFFSALNLFHILLNVHYLISVIDSIPSAIEQQQHGDVHLLELLFLAGFEQEPRKNLHRIRLNTVCRWLLKVFPTGLLCCTVHISRIS